MGASASPGTPRSALTGVWSVSHQNLASLAAPDRSGAAPSAAPDPAVELVTDVTFYWNEPAKSAFVTGTFNNWEATIPMVPVDGTALWTAVKALTPGDYQYKFIIDNVWRHAPDQPVAYDERGIINNNLTVTIEACGDPTCFCSRLAAAPAVASPAATATKQRKLAAMTPGTERRLAKSTGVASKYVEKTHHDQPAWAFRRSYMHNEINDRPFEVTVVNVKSLRASAAAADAPDRDGMMSRVSSFEDLPTDPPADRVAASSAAASATGVAVATATATATAAFSSSAAAADADPAARARYEPNVPLLDDAAYAAALRNDKDSSLPRTAAGRANMLQSDPTELAFSVRARLSTPTLGFDPKECHRGILLVDTCHCAVRVQEAGLYKTVRGALHVPVGRDVYLEIFVHKSSSSGGVCLGLSTRELPLACLVGARPNSIGFSTSGNLIRTVDGKERWSAFGRDSGSGCAVGMLVRLDHLGGSGEAMEGLSRRAARLEFFVDGAPVGVVDNFEFLGSMDVFPTLSLFARNARVYSLFNGDDMLHAANLPADRDIYTIDGRRINRDSDNTPKSLGFD